MFGKTKKVEEDMELIEDDLNMPDKKIVKQTKELMGIRQPDEPEIENPRSEPNPKAEEGRAPAKQVVVVQIFKDENGNLGIAFGEEFDLVQYHSFIVPHALALQEGFKQDHIESLKKAF